MEDILKPALLNVRTLRGDTWDRSLSALVAGEPLDLSAVEIRSEIRTPSGKLIAEVRVDKDPAIAGRFRIYLLPADTQEKPWGEYEWDLQFQFSETDVRTWVQGKFTLLKDVTKVPA